MPGPGSSPVCLTVICFLSWSLPLSWAQIWTDEVSDVQYGHLDSNVTLACGETQLSSPAVWRLNLSSSLPRHLLTSDGSLVLLRAERSAQGLYSCYRGDGPPVRSLRLRLGYSPGPLSVSCRVPSHTSVRCSWGGGATSGLPAHYNASFRGSKDEWRPCVMNASDRHCDFLQHAFWQPIHFLRITETNALGSETTYVTLRLHELLKPDPPAAVLVEELAGFPKRLTVSWSSPPTWPISLAYPLLFQIRYRPQGSVYWSEIYSEISPVVIFDALAGHVHQVQVRARDEVDAESQWSDWSLLLHIRPWEAFSTPDPTEEFPPDDDDDTHPTYVFPGNTKPETSTAKSHNPVSDGEGYLALMILLVLFSVVVLITVPSLIYVIWVRQRRRDHVTIQELTSMVKMKSMPI